MIVPKQYRTGIAYFMDFEFKVSPDTFIPRPETELLVERVIETVRQITESRKLKAESRILDIGTGCGNIAISLTKYLPQSKITALDISHGALLKAKENVKILGVLDRIKFLEGDLFTFLKEKDLFDIIVCNPPYVSAKDMEELSDEVKTEPLVALYGGIDGLGFYKKIIEKAPRYMKDNGYILMEMGYNQSESIRKLLEEDGYQDIEIFKDYSEIDRIVKAQSPKHKRWISS